MNRDYECFREDLERIDANLRASHVESMAVGFALEDLGGGARPQDLRKRAEFARVALRMELLRNVTGLPSFRKFSVELAKSDLLAGFCGILALDKIKWSSKSTLERASKLFTPGQMERMCALLTEAAADGETSGELGLEEAVDTAVCLVDATCLEAHIHYPVDWVLLRDVSRTLLKATKLIRGEGLLNRMEPGPEGLAREMNRLCIAMGHTRRRKDGRRARKAVLREMKTLLKRIGRHALAHRELLEARREQTRWSAREAARITARVDSMLDLLPVVIKQAHERIIGGRKVKNEDKVLSAYEADVHTLVRHKAGKEVEFGNGLFLAENMDGFILDHHLYKDSPPADTRKVVECLERLGELDVEEAVAAVVGDRGCDSRAVAEELGRQGVANMICPRDPAQLQGRMHEPEFRALQRRRGSTEARIAILKNKGGRVCRAKGFTNRSRQVAFGVLAHNFSWIARRVRERCAAARAQAAA